MNASTIIAARACPLCEATRVQQLHTQHFVLPQNHPLRDGYDVVSCVGCGFVYADTSATQQDYDEFYAHLSKYDDAQISTGAGLAPGDAARLQDTAWQIASLAQTHCLQDLGELSVLDVGCATGGLLHFLQRAGFGQTLGLDPSPQSAIFARQQFDLQVLTGGFFQAPPIEACDVVTCSHVLEHVRDLGEAALALKSWLRPGGIIYLEVPDAARYADYLVAPFQDFNTEHINHFDLRALDALMQRQGLVCVAYGSKAIEAAPGVPYPALWGAWQNDASAKACDVPEETVLADSIGRYIELSSALLERMDKRLREQLPPEAPVIVWGTGQLTMKLLAQTVLRQANICTFIDSNPLHHGETWAGVAVAAPSEIEHLNARYEHAPPILIASTIHQNAIGRLIREDLKLPNEILHLSD